MTNMSVNTINIHNKKDEEFQLPALMVISNKPDCSATW